MVLQGSNFLNHSNHSQNSTTNKNHIYSRYFGHMDREKLQKTVQNKERLYIIIYMEVIERSC